MHGQVLKFLGRADVIFMAAAVADYRVKNLSKKKIKKSDENLSIRLEKNPDILGDVLKRKRPTQFIMGFAAETDHLEKNALLKWKKKPCDLLVANLVGQGDTGFEGDRNELLVFSKKTGRPIRFPKDLKSRLAEKLLDLI